MKSHQMRVLRNRRWFVERGGRLVRGAMQPFYELSNPALDR
jgi:hypothetical protein